jgi:FkbM family methyltransferase
MEMMKTFIEIGACDFETNMDLIKTGHWLGIMCEPSPPYNKKLENIAENIPYRDNLTISDHAISDFNGKINFAVAKDNGHETRALGDWRRGISSVVAENHQGERLFDLKGNQKFVDYFVDVPCMTLNKLISESGWEHINYLKIDTEGHELNILEPYSWDIKPDVLKIEHTHIDDTYLKRLLEAQGYMVYVERNDLYALI